MMELADDSLADWNQEVRKASGEGVPAAELIAYFREAAEGLDYLHRMNVLHRDVKPANLLRLKGHAKVADFGLARMMEAKTETAAFVGRRSTWRRRSGTKRSAQSDQYSLAIAYAESRTGRPVFSGPTSARCASSTDGVPNLDRAAGRGATHRLAALAKDPEQRYPDCVTFIDALKAEFAPRRRGLAAVALGFGLLAVLGALIAVWALTRPPAPAVAVVPTPAEPLLPAGCQPDGNGLGRALYTRIVHPLPNAAPIVLLLIPQNKSGVPAPFYVMRDKVSNGQFNAAVRDPHMEELLTDAAKAGPWAVRRKWTKEGRGDPGQAALPVVYVTMPEARCFAHFLGGDLPTTTQWDKAAGRFDDAEGPFAIGKPPKGLAAVKNQGRDIPGPFPAGDPDGDESVFGCRDMADNGREWTCTTPRGDLINLPGKITADDQCHLRGGTFLGDDVFRFTDLKHQGLLSVQDPRNDVGFRVVIEAPAAAEAGDARGH